MLIRLLPLATGLLPVFAVHGSYAIALRAALVPACMPYIHGCTSISATGRQAPASYLFKAAMLPESILLVMFWVVSAAWLAILQHNAGMPQRSGRTLTILGSLGALCLVLYVTFLGTHEPFYEFMRRFGIYVYFAATVLAQLVLSLRVRQVAVRTADAALRRLASGLFVLAAAPFLLGALNLVLKSMLENPDPAENVIEWQVALLMHTYFVVAWAAWRQTQFRLSFAAGG